MRLMMKSASWQWMSVAFAILLSMIGSSAQAADDVLVIQIQHLERAGDESMSRHDYEGAALHWEKAYGLMPLDDDFSEHRMALLEKLVEVQLLLARMYHDNDQRDASEWLRRAAESCVGSPRYLTPSAGIYAEFLAAECRAVIRSHNRNPEVQAQPSGDVNDVPHAENLRIHSNSHIHIPHTDQRPPTLAQTTAQQLEQGEYWAAFEGWRRTLHMCAGQEDAKVAALQRLAEISLTAYKQTLSPLYLDLASEMLALYIAEQPDVAAREQASGVRDELEGSANFDRAFFDFAQAVKAGERAYEANDHENAIRAWTLALRTLPEDSSTVMYRRQLYVQIANAEIERYIAGAGPAAVDNAIANYEHYRLRLPLTHVDERAMAERELQILMTWREKERGLLRQMVVLTEEEEILATAPDGTPKVMTARAGLATLNGGVRDERLRRYTIRVEVGVSTVSLIAIGGVLIGARGLVAHEEVPLVVGSILIATGGFGIGLAVHGEFRRSQYIRERVNQHNAGVKTRQREFRRTLRPASTLSITPTYTQGGGMLALSLRW